MSKTKILVVEEENIIAQDIRLSLQNLGYDVCASVPSGEEAVKKTEENEPDLVLMDISLEDEMDGIEAAEQIRSRFDIPVVYLTAYADEEITERAKITEPYGYILKPFEDRELHSNIEIALYKHEMESKLKESEEWLSTTLRSIGDAVIATDTEGRIDFMNPVAQNLTGWNQEDAKEKPLETVFNVVNEKTGEKAENPVAKVIREGVVVGLANHTVLVSKDGTRRFIDDSGAPIRDEEGNITGVVLVFRDITERRQQEQKLRERNRLTRMLMENIPDQVYIKDREHRFIMVNEASAENLGCSREDAVGKTDADFFPKKMAEQYYEDEELVMETGEPVVNKEERTGREGEHWNSTTKIPMYDEEGNIVGVMGINREITTQKYTEEALYESEKKYRQLIENANETIIVIQDGQIKFFNPKAIEISGYSKEELTSKPFVEFIHPDDRDMVAGRHQRRLKGEEFPALYPFRFIDKDGAVKWLEVNAVQIEWEDRPATLNLLTDITERKQAEEALRESEQDARHFQEQLTALHEVSNELSKADSFDELCRQAIELGRDRLGFDRLGLWFIDDEDPQYIVGSFGTDENGQIRDERDQRLSIPEDGTIRAILEREETSIFSPNASLLNHRSQTIGQGAVTTDALWNGEKVIGVLFADNLLTQQPITEQQRKLLTLYATTLGHLCSLKKTEEELQASEKKFRGVAERSSDIIYTTDLEGKISYVSPSIEKIMGYKSEEVIGRQLKEFLPESEIPELRQALTETIEKGAVEGYQIKVKTKDGSIAFVEVSGAIIIEDGEISGFQGVIRDVTEREKMEAERQKLRKLESIEVLAGGIAHDFNNLLTGILGNISLAKMYCNDSSVSTEKLIETLEGSEKASLQARDLVKQLRTFARSGEAVKKAVSIPKLLRETVRFALSGSNVECEFSIPDNLWTIEADKGQISQVINNLVINADHAMPEGGTIQIRAENVTVEKGDDPQVNEGEYVKVSVEDQGVGISEENLSKIFDPYFSSKGLSTEKGTGLGLAISHSIIQEHKGYITAESELGAGTTFSIYLPKKKQEMEKAESKGDEVTGDGKILLMDDEEVVREVAGDILSRFGYEVDFAKDGAEAVEMYRKAKESGSPFDTVILDLTIAGGMGGEEAIKKLLRIDSEVKAIVSSGYPFNPVMLNFEQYGFSGAVAKPYNIGKLSEVLHELVG